MDALIGLFILVMAMGIYFVPTLIAFDRQVVNKWSVLVVNGLLGWTLIGWAVALALAVRDSTRKRPA
jgi:hypothetical protein